MDFAGTLRQMTLSEKHHPEIPAVVARIFGLNSLSIAVVRQGNDADCKILKLSSYRSRLVRMHNERADLEKAVLGWAKSETVTASACTDPACSCRHVVIMEKINASHLLVLAVHEQPGLSTLKQDTMEIMQLVAGYIARSLRGSIDCAENPQVLGTPLSTLSPTEWRVLRAMNSDDSEKQLAIRLDISLHSLHAHIKTIYRKLRVSGRMQAIQLTEEASYKYYVGNLRD